MQMYKVFTYNKTIIFTEDVNTNTFGENEQILKFESLSNLLNDFETFISNPKNNKLFIIIEKGVDKIFEEFLSNFQLIEAAGGIVRNSKNEYLFIYRFDKWDLPKGHIEKNEEPEMAAKREVEEETSISDLNIIKQLPCTFHSYILNNKKVIKKTYWFEMFTKSEQTPQPQINESITKTEWIPKNEVRNVLRNTYLSIKNFFIENFEL
ncbi:MAG: NUDIX domain-containing protein [Bacteroidales bacterium]|nr:NUDIX domain-containing protein [Bacteroidales bacterium]